MEIRERERTDEVDIGGAVAHPTFCKICEALCGVIAYERDGQVYFRGFPAIPGGTPALDEEHGELTEGPHRAEPFDVAVWRVSGPGDPSWPSPWGPGRPGWHAECTAMALSTYGSSLDLHAGGADLRFPHHAFEAAQAEAASGVTPFARSWMHVGTVRIARTSVSEEISPSEMRCGRSS